jgi:hypothetical protein
MKLKQYLKELSMSKKTGIEYKISAVEFLAYITLSNYDEYVFFADYDSDNTYWEVEFESGESGIIRRDVEPKIAVELFAALEQAFSKFIQSKKPKVFGFSGATDRIKLYDTIAKKITSKTKYKVEKEKDPTGGMIYFFEK